MIEIEGVSFSYRAGQADAVPALLDLDLSFSSDEFVTLIGHNGSGKSTLARLLTAFLFPTAGEVRIDGFPVLWENRWEVRERVAIVFQDPDDQLVASRVVDDVAFGPENLGRPRPELAERVEEALGVVGLQASRERLIAELSVSEKQLVAIAGALAMRPRYLIMDEPTAFLAEPQAQQLLQTVRHIHASQNMGVIHITHRMEEAVGADRVVVLDRGTVALSGPPREVFRDGKHLRMLGLDVPLPVSLSDRLRSLGVPVAGTPLTPDELAVALAAPSVSSGRARS